MCSFSVEESQWENMDLRKEEGNSVLFPTLGLNWGKNWLGTD